jgi:hypothetical protein
MSVTALGHVIDGKYELVELAGEGGMATVFKALARGAAGFTRTVAVKKLRRELRAIRRGSAPTSRTRTSSRSTTSAPTPRAPTTW